MGAMMLVLPLLLAAVGLAVIVLACNDKVDAGPADGSARLPTRRERPLYHLHMQIRAGVTPPSGSRAAAPGVTQLPRRREPRSPAG
jgi:hypothetical protein